MRVLSIFLGLINSLLAGLLITFLLTSADFPISLAWWSLVRILLALGIIFVGVLSWTSMVVPLQPVLLALGSLFLVSTGPATVLWTLHKASLTGRLEYYMLLYGASLVVQGCSLLLGLSEEQEMVSTV
jgi:hypothetical protein